MPEKHEREDAETLAQLRRAAQKGIDALEAGRYVAMESGAELDAYMATVREQALALLREAPLDHT